jgi:hypothetical protein
MSLCNSFSTLTTTTLPNFRRFKLSSAVMASTVTTTKVHPAVIVGGGRVGKALQGMGDGQDLLVRRGDSIPLDFDGPILVCTRNDDLDSVLQTTPLSRWNGTILSFNLDNADYTLQASLIN